MNTLSKELTLSILGDAEGYSKLVKLWSRLMQERTPLGAEHHLLYAVMRGKDWRKGFTAAINKKKLENGYRPAVLTAFTCITSSYRDERLLLPFDGILTKEGLIRLRHLLPSYSSSMLEQPAYKVPEIKTVAA